jgi:hypothetical protein
LPCALTSSEYPLRLTIPSLVLGENLTSYVRINV